jgi:hypothetical protein
MGVDVDFLVVDDNWKEVESVAGARAAWYNLDDTSIFQTMPDQSIVKDKDGEPYPVDMYSDNGFMYTTKALLLQSNGKKFTQKELKAFEKYPDNQKVVVCWF